MVHTHENELPPLATPRQVAEYLGVSISSVYRGIHEGRWLVTRLGDKPGSPMRIIGPSVEAYLRARASGPMPDDEGPSVLRIPLARVPASELMRAVRGTPDEDEEVEAARRGAAAEHRRNLAGVAAASTAWDNLLGGLDTNLPALLDTAAMGHAQHEPDGAHALLDLACLLERTGGLLRALAAGRP
jgi:excisionase family DNA binding protein